MKKKNKLILVILIVFILLLLRFSPLSNLISFQQIINFKNEIQHFIDYHYILSVAIFMMIYFSSVVLLMPWEGILTIAAGFFFGFFPTIIYVIIIATIGATTYLLISRHLMENVIRENFQGKLKNFSEMFEKEGLIYILTIRFIPIIPSALINSLASLTNISVFNFIWTNAIGIIPPTILYAYAGKELGTINSAKELLSYKLVVITLLLSLPLIASILYRKIKNHKI